MNGIVPYAQYVVVPFDGWHVDESEHPMGYVTVVDVPANVVSVVVVAVAVVVVVAHPHALGQLPVTGYESASTDALPTLSQHWVAHDGRHVPPPLRAQ